MLIKRREKSQNLPKNKNYNKEISLSDKRLSNISSFEKFNYKSTRQNKHSEELKEIFGSPISKPMKTNSNRKNYYILGDDFENKNINSNIISSPSKNSLHKKYLNINKSSSKNQIICKTPFSKNNKKFFGNKKLNEEIEQIIENVKQISKAENKNSSNNGSNNINNESNHTTLPKVNNSNNFLDYQKNEKKKNINKNDFINKSNRLKILEVSNDKKGVEKISLLSPIIIDERYNKDKRDIFRFDSKSIVGAPTDILHINTESNINLNNKNNTTNNNNRQIFKCANNLKKSLYVLKKLNNPDNKTKNSLSPIKFCSYLNDNIKSNYKNKNIYSNRVINTQPNELLNNKINEAFSENSKKNNQKNNNLIHKRNKSTPKIKKKNQINIIKNKEKIEDKNEENDLNEFTNSFIKELNIIVTEVKDGKIKRNEEKQIEYNDKKNVFTEEEEKIFRNQFSNNIRPGTSYGDIQARIFSYNAKKNKNKNTQRDELPLIEG